VETASAAVSFEPVNAAVTSNPELPSAWRREIWSDFFMRKIVGGFGSRCKRKNHVLSPERERRGLIFSVHVDTASAAQHPLTTAYEDSLPHSSLCSPLRIRGRAGYPRR
jgi:hypothetical protein